MNISAEKEDVKKFFRDFMENFQAELYMAKQAFSHSKSYKIVIKDLDKRSSSTIVPSDKFACILNKAIFNKYLNEIYCKVDMPVEITIVID